MSYGSVVLNDGNRVPRIAFGAGSVWKREDVTEYVQQALEHGFVHLDNAQYYANEEFVGAALAASGIPRSQVFITSKYGYGDVDAAFNASLEKLGVEYLDLYLIHNPAGIPAGEIPAVWAKLEAIRKSGLAKSIGVSNFNVEQLRIVLGSGSVVPAVNQIELHPYNYHKQLATIRFCGECGIAIEAYSSLTPITKTPGGPLDPVLARIAQRIGGTPAQVIFAWLRQKGIIIVTTSGKSERLREYLAVPTLPPLTDGEILEIEAAGRKGATPVASQGTEVNISVEKSVTKETVDVEAQMAVCPSRRLRSLFAIGFISVLAALWVILKL